MRRIIQWLVLVFVLLCPGSIALGASSEPIDLRQFAVALDTSRCPATGAAVAALPDRCFVPFAALRETISTTYFAPAELWLRVRVPPAVAPGRHWLLRLSWMVDKGDLTVVGPAGEVEERAPIGMEIPTARRVYHVYDDRVPLPAAFAAGDILVLHAISKRAEFAPLELWTEDAIAAQDRSDSRTYFTPLAFLSGMLVAMALFNLLLFFMLRRPSYLLYSLAMFAMVVFQTIQSGVAWTLLWPGLPVRDDAPAYVSYVVYFGLVIAFAREFLGLRRVSAIADNVLLASFAVLFLDMVLYVLFPGALSVTGLWDKLDPIAVLFAIAALVGAGIVAWIRGVNSARYYVIGFSGAAIGILMAEAADYRIISAPIWDDLWSALGVAWEAIFLAFALADRIREAEREAARLTEFAYLDQLTAIPNRRAFDEALEREWRRGTRTLRPLSLLIFDIDRFKAYNDTYGHQAGDEALRAVATEIARAARRPGDFAARYGGEEFALVLAETPHDGAVAAAEAVRLAVRALEIVHGEGHLTISVGCATMIPRDDISSAVLISRADEALYAAKAAGRDCTVAAPPDETGAATVEGEA